MICPIIKEKCHKDKCAFFLSEAKKCSVVAIGETFEEHNNKKAIRNLLHLFESLDKKKTETAVKNFLRLFEDKTVVNNFAKYLETMNKSKSK